MKRIEENASFIKATSVAHPDQCKALLRTAKKNQLDAICEILLNVVRGTVTLSDTVFTRAKRYKKVLRQLVAKCSNKSTRKELMIKYFRIIQTLLAATLPLIGVFFSGVQMYNSVS